MLNIVQHLYKYSTSHGGLLYAWLSSMHTRVDIVLCGKQGEEQLMLVANAINELLCRLEKMANYYDAESELGILNRTAAISPKVVSQELYDMVAFCLDCYPRTVGYFDVTVHSDNYKPDTIHCVELSAQERTVAFLRPGVTINLSGFLKGYALEKIREILKRYEVEDALVNMGNSSVLALGHHPMAEGWKVSFGQMNSREVFLQDECLTTSGNESDERKHIVNSRSGELEAGKRIVAVVTTDGMIGEVLSTSLFVADISKREIMKEEFHPRLVIDF